MHLGHIKLALVLLSQIHKYFHSLAIFDVFVTESLFPYNGLDMNIFVQLGKVPVPQCELL